MKKRNLERAALISSLGLGCNVMTFLTGRPKTQEIDGPPSGAVRLAITFFDTAEVYGPCPERITVRAKLSLLFLNEW